MSRWSEAYLAGVEMQRIILGKIKDPKTGPKDLVSLSKAYSDLEEMKRKNIAKRTGKPSDPPKPKDIEPASYSDPTTAG